MVSVHEQELFLEGGVDQGREVESPCEQEELTTPPDEQELFEFYRMHGNGD